MPGQTIRGPNGTAHARIGAGTTASFHWGAVAVVLMRHRFAAAIGLKVLLDLQMGRWFVEQGGDGSLRAGSFLILIGSPTDTPIELACVCDFLQEIMVNPVLAADGHTYELIAIQRWMEKSDRSPMTNMKLPTRELTPNLEVRQKIQEWQEKQASRGR